MRHPLFPEVNQVASDAMPLQSTQGGLSDLYAYSNAGAHVRSGDNQDSLQSNIYAHSHARDWQVYAQCHAYTQAKDKQTSLQNCDPQ